MVQPIGNEDFDVSIKIDSPIVATDANTSQGLMVLVDDRGFLTFALVTDEQYLAHRAQDSAGVTATVFNQASSTISQSHLSSAKQDR